MAITFTNKAAAEMKSRLGRLLSEDSDDSADCDVTAGTFHSVCLRILRKHHEAAGYASSFTIYDTDDTKKAIQACMKELYRREDACCKIGSERDQPRQGQTDRTAAVCGRGGMRLYA